MHLLRGLIAAGLLLSVALLCGCGGGGGAGAQKPLTKAQYIGRGDALCRDFESRIQKVRGDVQTSTSTTAAAFYQRLVDEAERLSGRFHALSPPADGRAILEQYIAAQDKALTIFKQIVAAETAGDNRKAGALLGAISALRQSQPALATAYGFKDCGAGTG